MANLKNIVRGNLANVSQQTITKDTFYEVEDMPIGGITNTEMVAALTIPKRGFYQEGSVYMCTDTVANQYTEKHFYKFMGSSWEDVTPITSPQIITNTTVSTWVADSTYTGFGYKADITVNGITANDVAEVIFGQTEASSGNYASVTNTSTNTVTIYSKVNTSITIPTILIIKGGI